jgi:lysophospholipase L1-like esterase
MKKITLFILSLLLFVPFAYSESRIVILGSSSAAGIGPLNSDNTWVNRYRTYVKSLDPSHKVINLAVGGYTTYHLMPTEFVPNPGRPAPDPAHNITKALSYNPDAIIINLPSNDVANGYSIEEQLSNYTSIIGMATVAGIPVWISTTQPRNFSEATKRTLQKQIADMTLEIFGENTLDFWTPFATENNTIISMYDCGDGIHFNDQAHEVVYNVVVAADILSKITNHPVDGSNNKVLENPVFIDFGLQESAAPWNNMTTFNVGGILLDLIDSNSNNTGINIEISDDFGGENAAGPTNTSTKMNLPAEASVDCFWGNTLNFQNRVNARAEITFSGLNVNQKYDFDIFGSRSGSSDNREAALEFVGTESEVYYLNASNNTANTITASAIKPDENGVIYLRLTAGPNNNNSSGFFYLNALKIYPSEENINNNEPVVLNHSIDIDFGLELSPAPWNNITSYVLGTSILNLIDINGNETKISIEIDDEFSKDNILGPLVTNTLLDLPQTASKDCLWGNAVGVFDGRSEATGGLLLSNLYPDAKYDFLMFASRSATDNRETYITASGKNEATAYVNASDNTENLAIVSEIIPNDNGTISITVGAGPQNNNGYKFYYINSLRISPAQYTGYKLTAGEDNFILISNPENNILSLDLKTTKSTKVSILDLLGKTVYESAQLNYGKNQIDITYLNKGIYLIVAVNDKNELITKKFIK